MQNLHMSSANQELVKEMLKDVRGEGRDEARFVK